MADIADILGEPAETTEQLTAKFRPRVRPKPCKAASKASNINPDVAAPATKKEASTEGVVSHDTDDNQEHGCSGIAEPVTKEAPFAIDSISQDNSDNKEKGHRTGLSQEPRDQESIAVLDTLASSVSGNQGDVNMDSLDEPIAPSTASASVVHDIANAAASSPKGKMFEELTNIDAIHWEQAENIGEQTTGKFWPKAQAKLGKAAASKAFETNPNVVTMAAKVRDSTIDAVSCNTDDNHEKGCSGDLPQESRDQASIVVLGTLASSISGNQEDADTIFGLDFLDELLTPASANEEPTGRTKISQHRSEASVHELDRQVMLSSMDSLDDITIEHNNIGVGETGKCQLKIGRKKGNNKSVSFVLPDGSKTIVPSETHSEMGNLTEASLYSEKTMTNENLSDPSQLSPTIVGLRGDSCSRIEEHGIPDEHHSNNLEDAGQDAQYQDDGEPIGHIMDKSPRSDIGENGSSRKLRSRKSKPKVGIPEGGAGFDFDNADYIDSLINGLDDDSGEEYKGEGKQKGRKRSKKGNDESDSPSRGRKRNLKDSTEEPPEKKLSHRIRQKKRQVDKTLLEMPESEINRRQISIRNLILLAEAKERIGSKEQTSGTSSFNQSSARSGGYVDDFDFFGDEEPQDYNNDGTNHSVQKNSTKLNYHSYMSRHTVRWSKSDTELFYQAIRQFGTDFAMIQQLFPNRTRHQVKLKFKNEERKNPMLVHDALLHRSKDHSHFKRVIQQLKVQDMENVEIGATDSVRTTSDNAATENENAEADFTNKEEEEDFSWVDKEQSPTFSDGARHGEHGSAADDDLDDVFDWY